MESDLFDLIIFENTVIFVNNAMQEKKIIFRKRNKNFISYEAIFLIVMKHILLCLQWFFEFNINLSRDE